MVYLTKATFSTRGSQFHRYVPGWMTSKSIHQRCYLWIDRQLIQCWLTRISREINTIHTIITVWIPPSPATDHALHGSVIQPTTLTNTLEPHTAKHHIYNSHKPVKILLLCWLPFPQAAPFFERDPVLARLTQLRGKWVTASGLLSAAEDKRALLRPIGSVSDSSKFVNLFHDLFN